MSSADQLFYSGTSGVNLLIPRMQFPVEFLGKSRLAYYASLFNSIEINSIFYKLPRYSTVRNWAESVPENFRFTFKVSKTITHSKKLKFEKKDVNDFIRTVDHIGEKKGCLLAQFPPSLKVEMLNELQMLLETLGEATYNSGWKLAMEFRDPLWYEREVYELLQEYDAVMVLQDMPKSATPFKYATGDFVYLRFHGPEARYRGSYNDEFLKRYAKYIQTWINENKTVYAYFNNTAGTAVENLVTLNKYVQL